jgi:1-acyl-sn-glycerol-3-phosphate acyltransferase
LNSDQLNENQILNNVLQIIEESGYQTTNEETKDTSYVLPLYNRIARFILRPIFRGIFHLISQVHIKGSENVPEQGAYVIAINHISLFDPPFMVAFWPVCPEAAGAVEIWNRPGQSILARLYGGIRVHRGQYDRKMIDTVLKVLKSERPLLIAPEGGRTHTPGLRRALPGIAQIVDLAQVPVVPVGVVGSTDDFLERGLKGRRPRIEMRIGEPFRLPPLKGKGKVRRSARQRNADKIMMQIAALLPPEYRGVYATPVSSESIER